MTTSRLVQLDMLQLSCNQLAGVLPEGLMRLRTLRHLGAYSNSLSGGIPACMRSLSKLSALWLLQNMLVGALPASVSPLRSGVFPTSKACGIGNQEEGGG